MSFANNLATAAPRADFGSRDQGRVDGASDDVLAILEAANDFGDHDTADACRRIIAANKDGAPVSPADMKLMLTYFR